ncbi:MAG: N-acetylmuramoyl-L-alanine amidase family protein [Rectinemataceae bacterium]
MNLVQAFLPIGPARPGVPLDTVLAIVLHWPDAPGQTAEETHDYWAGGDNKEGASAHCAISENGAIIQCVPWREKAFHVGSSLPDPASGKIYTDLARNLFGAFAEDPASSSPNHCTIGIEMETVDDLGTYTPATIEAALELCVELCGQFHLDPATRIIRHVDVVGWKRCPAWYIDHPEDLDNFRAAVAAKMGS